MKHETTADADNAERCQRCGHENTVWYAPSPLWNAVMRGGCIDGEPEFGDMVCAACFMVLSEQKGIAQSFRVTADTITYPLQTTTPSGREWDEKNWKWVQSIEQPASPDDEELCEALELHAFDDCGERVVETHLCNQAASRIRQLSAQVKALEAERDSALREMSSYAREAGEAKGKLEASELAGVVEGWKERALAAEAKLVRKAGKE